MLSVEIRIIKFLITEVLEKLRINRRAEFYLSVVQLKNHFRMAEIR